MAPERLSGPVTGPDRAARLLLGLAAVAVAFAAADTYVVVLSLPDMMGSVGLSVDELQRAAPIVSGFLLGYVAMLPLIGRIADLRGRTPVLVAALVVFAFGSLVTAAAYDLESLVAGRFLQGVGGGGLVPVTLALVADLYPADRRGVPLGVVGAVQELGSVLGPLYGAVVLSFGTWRDIFWINLAVGLVLAAAVTTLTRRTDSPRRSRSSHRRVDNGNVSDYPVWRRVDWVGLGLLALVLISMLLVMRQPSSLVSSVDLGGPFVPFSDGGSIWWSQLGVLTVLLGVAFVGWLLVAPRPLVDLRDWWRSVREADLVGAGPAVGRPRRDHPRLRHGRPRGAGVLAGRALVPRPRRRSPPCSSGCTTAAPARRSCRTARSRSDPPGARCW